MSPGRSSVVLQATQPGTYTHEVAGARACNRAVICILYQIESVRNERAIKVRTMRRSVSREDGILAFHRARIPDTAALPGAIHIRVHHRIGNNGAIYRQKSSSIQDAPGLVEC